MAVSVVLACIQRIAIGYRFIPHFLLDYVAHLTLSLWGVYLVKSKQVQLNKKDCVIGGSVILCVAFVMIIFNLIFDTSFFGLTFGENYNIYNMVLVPSAYLSATIYIISLCFVLVLGGIYLKNIKSR